MSDWKEERGKKHTHETSRISLIGSHFSIDFDQTLFYDSGDLAACECVLQPVSEEDCDGKGFAKFVWTWRRARSICSAKFVEHP